MPAFFKCKNCGQEHRSPLYFPDEKTFDVDNLGTISLSCPTLGRTAAYEKKDMFWLREETKAQNQER